MDIYEIKRIEYDILQYVASFCEKNGIHYFLFYGTLLGAARHKGFIPWDDDIDICIPRDDYERFLSIFYDASGVMRAVDVKNTIDYIYPFAKVIDTRYPIKEKSRFNCGLCIYIDVFPIDAIPQKPILRLLYEKKMLAYKLIWSISISQKCNKPETLVRRILACILTQRRISCLTKRIDAYAKRNGKNGDLLCVYFDVTKTTLPIFKREWVSDLGEIQFEGGSFSAPSDYYGVLSWLYGDYMKLPPIEERVSNHSFVIIEKNH